MRQRPSKRLSRPIVRRNRPLETARPAETPLYGRRATSRLRTPIASRISRHDPAHTPTLVACRLSVCGPALVMRRGLPHQPVSLLTSRGVASPAIDTGERRTRLQVGSAWIWITPPIDFIPLSFAPATSGSGERCQNAVPECTAKQNIRQRTMNARRRAGMFSGRDRRARRRPTVRLTRPVGWRHAG
jgi:hypothetical protein